MLILKTLVFLFFAILGVYSQTKPTTLTIQGTIFDQWPGYNDNFEAVGCCGSNVKSTGMVQSTLSEVTRVPLLNTNVTTSGPLKLGTMVSPDTFKWFFTSNQNAPKTKNAGLNMPIPIDIVLNLDSDSGSYVYDQQKYFPLDNIGFDTNSSFRIYKQSGVYHNFHFCLKINSKFTYSGNEIFNFVGDDDVWVYIDNKLVVDLGGVHPAQTGNVDLSKLGLIKSKVYNFDFFYCERHTDGSSIRIETTIQAYCPWYDYCGVCTGDGSVCCNTKTAGAGQISCDDGNLCTTDSCPSPTTVVEAGKTLKNYCQNTPVVYAGDKCNVASCDPKTGGKVLTPIPPPNREDECLQYVKCDPTNGFIYQSTCTSPCHTGKCVNKACEVKTANDCGEELDGTPNSCKVYSCDAKAGCVSSLLCPQNNTDSCKINTCSSNNSTCYIKVIPEDECDCGCVITDKCKRNNCVLNPITNKRECSPLPIDGIDDGNPCTKDECVNGTITHTPLTHCGGCMKCDPKSANGTCIANDDVCDDHNLCTVNTCSSFNSTFGSCLNSTYDCTQENPDKCLSWECTPDGGCASSPLVCPDSGNCQVGACDSNTGCYLKPRQCNATAYCIISECDPSVGCISYDRRCASDDNRCQVGICVNGTTPDKGECRSVDYDPLPFICKTAAVISTAVIAGVTVAAAVAAGIFAFAGKKGYDYWKEHRNVKFTASNANPLYVQNANSGINPLYDNEATNATL